MKPFKLLFLLSLSLLFFSCGASKELSAEAASAKSSLAECQVEMTKVQQQLADARARLVGSDQLSQQNQQLLAANNELQTQLTVTRAKLATTTQEMQASSDNYGVWYRVQIGAYEERRIANKLETTDQLSLETKNDLQKIALGRFRIYDDAQKLQTQLQAMGLKDAWIVSYKDGVRVPIEEVKGK